MSRNASSRLTIQSVMSISLTVAGVLFAASSWAQTAYFSGPSVTKLTQPTTFSGKGFAPNSALTVMIQAPSGSTQGYSAIASTDGSFNYTVTFSFQGPYQITVADSGGKTLAAASVAVLP